MLNKRIRDYIIMHCPEKLESHFNEHASEIDSYVLGGEVQGDFDFDASSNLAWRNALRIIGIPLVPISAPLVVKDINDKKAMKIVGEELASVLNMFRGFARSDAPISADLLEAVSRGDARPGLRRHLLRYSRVEVTPGMHKHFSEYCTFNRHVFYVQDADKRDEFHSVVFSNNKYFGEPEFRTFVEGIVEKLSDFQIRPAHPQYSELGVNGPSFIMKLVKSRTYEQEVAVADAGIFIPLAKENAALERIRKENER